MQGQAPFLQHGKHTAGRHEYGTAITHHQCRTASSTANASGATRIAPERAPRSAMMLKQRHQLPAQLNPINTAACSACVAVSRGCLGKGAHGRAGPSHAAALPTSYLGVQRNPETPQRGRLPGAALAQSGSKHHARAGPEQRHRPAGHRPILVDWRGRPTAAKSKPSQTKLTRM